MGKKIVLCYDDLSIIYYKDSHLHSEEKENNLSIFCPLMGLPQLDTPA